MLNPPKIKGQFLNQSGSPRFASEAGVFPILFLVVIGATLVGGGAYAVKNKLVAIKNGQIVFNVNKPKDIYSDKIPVPKNTFNNSPAPKKAELSQNSAEYKPETGEPKFSITPPAGWVKEKGEGKVKLFFEASQEDKKEFGLSTSRSTANIQVTSEKSSAKSLDEVMAKYKKGAALAPVKIEVLKEQKTTFAGQNAIQFEIIVSLADVSDAQIEAELKKAGNQASVKDVQDMLKSGKVRGLSYIMLKDGYEIGIGGAALGAAWDKRGPQIESSINSFKFLDDSAKTQTHSPSPTTTQSVAVSTGKPIDISGYNTVFGSKEELSWDNPSKMKPPIPFSMKEPLNWQKKVPTFVDNKSYSVEYEGEEESQTGKNGAVTKTRPLISVEMIYKPSSDLEQEIKKLKASIKTYGANIINEKGGTFFGETGYYLEGTSVYSKTEVLSKSQSYLFYKNDYLITVSMNSLDSTWSKWQPAMKSIIDSFKFL